jgi:hypothetical protein
MSTSIYNNKPYYDDIHVKDANGLSPAEKFQRILFKPGTAVQARELTQIQSLLQQQISNIGDHFFKEGSLIVPGNITHNSTLDYIKVAHDPAKPDSFYTDLINHTVFEYDGNTELETPIKASIKIVKRIVDTWFLYIDYTSSNPVRLEQDPPKDPSFFSEGDIIKILNSAKTDELTVDSNNIDSLSGNTLKAAATTISAGIYYINKLFVVVPEQTIMSVDIGVPFKKDLNFSVGLKITEEFITSDQDHSLNDNSLGTNNTRASGADRLHVKATLESTEIVDSAHNIVIPSSNYIELLRVVKSNIIKKVNKTAYNLLADELARRTSDESGDYTIAPFTLDIKNANRSLDPEIDDYFEGAIGKSKAYVKGFEIETIAPTSIQIPTSSVSEATLITTTASNEYYLIIQDVNGHYAKDQELVLMGKRPTATTSINATFGWETEASELGIVRISHIVPISSSNGKYKMYIYPASTDIEFNIASWVTRASELTASQQLVDDTYRFHARVDSVHIDNARATKVFEIADKGVTKLNNILNYQSAEDDGYASYYEIEEIETTLQETFIVDQTRFHAVFETNSTNIFDASKLNAILMNPATSGMLNMSDEPSTQIRSIFTHHNNQFIFSSESDGFGLDVPYYSSSPITNGNPRELRIEFPLSADQGGAANSFVNEWEAGMPLTLVIATKVTKDKGAFKTKTLTEASWTIDTGTLLDNDSIPFVSALLPNDPIYDVYDIVSVKNADDENDDTDYSNYFYVDNGYDDYQYKASRLTVTPGISTGTRLAGPDNLTCVYRYFKHHGNGNFFSIESYEAEVLDNLPTYESTNYKKLISVGNVIDFRTPSTESSVTLEANTLIELSTAIAKDRKDIVTLDTNGVFNIITGVPGVIPIVPNTPKNSLKLYELMVPANSWKASDITMKRMNNRRYTMRDIGKIEKRVNRLEKYTTLSLLESDTMNIDIGRMKSGFFVDSFKDYSKSAITHSEFRSEIDPTNNIVKCTSTRKNFNLSWADSPGVLSNGIEDELSASLTSILNIKKTGALITLDYEEIPEVQVHLDATGSINVNPYMIPSYTGRLELSPASDDWKDTDRRPEVVFEQPGLYDAMLANINMDDLGIFWNDWQTTWTGLSGLVSDSRGDNLIDWIGNSLTTITTRLQVRTGIEKTLEETTELVDMGDRVVSVNLASSMRTRLISFKGVGLKPNTTFAATFDEVDVTRFCRMDKVFIDHTLEGDYPDVPMALNYSNWTKIGYLNVNHHPGGPSSLTTDEFGNIIGSFWLPNLDNINFRTGDRIFRLTDGFLGQLDQDVTINREVETTTASSTYSAIGLIESKEHLTLSTRLPYINTHEIAQKRTLITTDVQHRDPLAQSFVLNRTEYPDGLFATSIDLYFKQKDLSRDVSIELREMRDGAPTIKVIPFSRVTLNPSEVNEITKEMINIDGGYDDLVAARTKFKFSSPVYLSPGVEYCWVLEAESDNYEVWYHTKGLKSLITGEMTNTQLFSGTMFKSSNASTWSPDQDSDIPFTLNRAKFNINKKGSVNFKEKIGEPGWGLSSNLSNLEHNPFIIPAQASIVPGVGSCFIVEVKKTNHGFKQGRIETLNSTLTPEMITISGATGLGGFDWDTSFNKIHTIESITDKDTLQILILETERSAPTDGRVSWVTMRSGGANVVTSFSIDYSTFHLQTSEIVPNNTGINWNSWHTRKGSSNITDYLAITSNDTIHYDKQFTIESSDANTQCGFVGLLSSTSDLISPSIDLDRVSVIAVENIITSAATVTSVATYVSKSIDLSDTSAELRLLLDVYSPDKTEVIVYHKTSGGKWTKFDIDGSNTPIDSIPNSNNFEEIELKYEVTSNGNGFNSYQIKIEMFADNPAIVPIVSNLRVITGITT